MQKTKNMKIRQAMLYNGLSQADVARLLAVSPTKLSMMLAAELAEEEQDKIVEIINKYESEA